MFPFGGWDPEMDQVVCSAAVDPVLISPGSSLELAFISCDTGLVLLV